jgi:hypothetical protein
MYIEDIFASHSSDNDDDVDDDVDERGEQMQLAN